MLFGVPRVTQIMNLYSASIYVVLVLCVGVVSFANADLTCSSSFVIRNDSSVDQIVAKVRVHYFPIKSG
jgi:hypothetical protein